MEADSGNSLSWRPAEHCPQQSSNVLKEILGGLSYPHLPVLMVFLMSSVSPHVMPLYLIQPECLLLGGSHQAMPKDAKEPSVFRDFVEVRSQQAVRDPQDTFGSQTEKEKFLCKLFWVQATSPSPSVPH